MDQQEDDTPPVPSQALSTSIVSFLTGRCYEGASEELAGEVFAGVLENVDLPRLSLQDASFLLKQVHCIRPTVIKCIDTLIGRCDNLHRQDGEEGTFAYIAIDYAKSNSVLGDETRLSSAADLEKVWSMLYLLLHALRFGNVDGVHTVDFGCPTSVPARHLFFSPITELLQLGIRVPSPTWGQQLRFDYISPELPLGTNKDYSSYDWFSDSVHCLVQYVAQQSPHLLGLANEEGKTPLHLAVVSCFSGEEIFECLEYDFRYCSRIANVDTVRPGGAGSLLVPAIITACPDSALVVDNNGNSALHVLVDFVLRNGFSQIPLTRFHLLLRECPTIVAVPRRNGRFPLTEILEYSKGIDCVARDVFFLIGMFLRACKCVDGSVGTLSDGGIIDLFLNFLPNFDDNDHMDGAFGHCIEQMTAVLEVCSDSREPSQSGGIQCLFKGLDAIARLHDAVETNWDVDNNAIIAPIEQFARKAVVYDSGENGLSSLQMPNDDCGTKEREWIFQFTGRIGYRGRYLLHTAAATGSPNVQKLATANPEIIFRKDPATGLYPFQAAASTGDLAGLNNAYLLLKENPGVMSALTGGKE